MPNHANRAIIITSESQDHSQRSSVHTPISVEALPLANSPTPSMKVNPTEAGGVPDVSSMEWSDIHKMVKTMGGE